ncbi:hypothetical protein B0H13DRAFT_1922877 [Mycena leptocephala]|nr:hypothetical protein B0H13DRAFT_1922877 [Mycena leptocephala]
MHTLTRSCGLRTSLIPACGHIDDAQLGMLVLVRAEAAFGGTGASCTPTSWISCACRWGGDDEARRWGWDADADADADLMKTEKRADGDGNADGDGGGGVRLPVLSLRFGTLSLCPPALVLPSFALVPAFAHTLAPTLLLVPVMLASTWCGMDALAASCSVLEKRGCGCRGPREHIPFLTVFLGIALFIWVYFWVWMRTDVSVEAQMENSRGLSNAGLKKGSQVEVYNPCFGFGTMDPNESNLQVAKPPSSSENIATDTDPSYPDAVEEVVDSERKDFCTYLPPRNIDYTEEKERKNLDIAFYNELWAQERYYRTIGYQMLNRLDDKALTLSSSVELSSKRCQTNRHAIASEIGKLSLEFNRRGKSLEETSYLVNFDTVYQVSF